ncbi:MAG TPA: hypothetical protein VF808_03270 [Ktedonobacterales bacterium]
MAARFPTRDRDGSFTIAARFRSSNTHARTHVAAIIADAIARREVGGAPAFTSHFHGPPSVERQDEEVFDVVFHGSAESPRTWKDWLVMLVRELEAPEYGLRFESFIDRVSGRRHP